MNNQAFIPWDRALLACLVVCLSACVSKSGHREQSASPRYLLPIHAYILQGQHSDLDGNLSQPQLERIIVDVNRIWQQANIGFYLASYANVSAQKEQAYTKAVTTWQQNQDHLAMAYHAKSVCPQSNQTDTSKALRLCVIGQLFNGAGGVYFNDEQPLVMWPSTYFGSTYKSAIFLAHELGHVLDLPHNNGAVTHLMKGKRRQALGKHHITKMQLTEDEIHHARQVAAHYPHSTIKHINHVAISALPSQ